MNYQTSALWFYKPFYYLAVLLCVGLTFFGFSSPLFYIMMTGLILPVIVSMRLNTLSEAGNAWLIKERSDWMVYVNGIPVQEQRSSLTNPCFSSPERLRQFYLRGFTGKLAIQVVAMVMLFRQGLDAELVSYKALAEAVLGIILLLLLISTVKTLRAVAAHRWEIQAITSVGGSQWYQAFFKQKDNVQPALDKLCSLR